MLSCTDCGHDNRPGARFCEGCGSALGAPGCVVCGHELRPGARFCDECGSAVEGAAKKAEVRKTISAVFSDMVGSTALQEKLDQESVRHVMGRFYEVMSGAVADHGGHLEKFIGDAVVAVWGHPVVGEDDALQAVLCAAAMVAALEPLNVELQDRWGVQIALRTGVNTGEVVVSTEGFLVGDTMNTAARLEQNAPTGGILVGEPTWRLVRHRVSLEPAEPIAAKGKSEPVPAWLLASVDPGSEEGGLAETPFVGRSDELVRARAVFDAAVAEKTCKLVTVIGAPGVGKSRLVAELAGSVEGEALVLRGHCEASGEGNTFLPVAEVLREATGVGEGDSPDEVLAKLKAILGQDHPDAERAARLAAAVLGVGVAASPQETFWALRRGLEALANRQPLLLLLDDVHWGEPQFLDLVEHLVEWVRDAPIALVAVARPELRELRDAFCRPGPRVTDAIELSPLDATHSRALLDGMVGGVTLPASVLENAGGNPLFLGELVRMLVDDGALRREGEEWVLADGASLDIPPTINALLAARLERLRPDERNVVERASVIGKQFFRGAVVELTTAAVGIGVDNHLEALRRKELVEPEGTYWIDEPVFRFHHVLIRDAAYRSLLKEARAELHEKFAGWLEGKAGELVGEHEEVIAFHLEQAHEYRRQLGPLDDRGRELGRQAAERFASAGRRALAREDLSAAANLLRRSLDRVPEPDAEVLLDLCEALLSAGEVRAATAPVAQLREVAGGDARLDAAAATAEVELAWLAGTLNVAEADHTLETAIDALRTAGDHRRLAKALELRGTMVGPRGQNALCEAALDEGLAAARAAGDSRRVASILSVAPMAALWGPTSVARASGRCLDIVRILRMTPGSRHVEARALRAQAVLESMRGRQEAALSLLAAARTTAEELGLEHDLAETDAQAARIHLMAGEAAEAETRIRSALATDDRLGVAIPSHAALLARTLVDLGRDDEALAACDAVGEDAALVGPFVTAASVRAEVLARRGDCAQAVAMARRAVDRGEETDALVDQAEAWEALARVSTAAGDDAAAAEARAAAHERYTRKGHDVGAARTGAGPGAAAPGGEVQEGGEDPFGLVCAINERRWDDLAGLVADDIVYVDRRDVMMLDRREGAAAYVDLMRHAADTVPNFGASVRGWHDGGSWGIGTLALMGDTPGGDRAGVEARMLVLLHGARPRRLELLPVDGAASNRATAGFGADVVALATKGEDAALGITGAALSVRGVDDAGRLVTDAVFALDEIDKAWEAFETLDKGADAEPDVLGLFRALNDRRWDDVAAVVAEDLVYLDRRDTATADRREGADAYLSAMRSVVDVVPDARWTLRDWQESDGTGTGRLTLTGSTPGGDGALVEMRMRAVHDGTQIQRLESLPLDDGLEEAAGEARPSPIVAIAERYAAAFSAADWAGLRATLTDDYRAVDHRRGSTWGEASGVDDVVARQRALREEAGARDMRWAVEILAGDDETVALRNLVSGALEDGGEFEMSFLSVHVLSGERLALGELFDAQDEEGCLARLAELRRAPGRVMAIWDKFKEAHARREWDVLSTCLADDIAVSDRRSVVSVGDLTSATEYVARLRQLTEIAGDTRWELGEVVAELDDVAIAKARIVGHWDHGGAWFELPIVCVGHEAGGVIDRMAMFDADNVPDAMRMAFDLSAGGAIATRYLGAYARRDWDDLRDLLTDDFVLHENRKAVAHADGAGPDRYIEVLAALPAVSPDSHHELDEVLDLAEDRVSVRVMTRGHWADGSGEFEIPVRDRGPFPRRADVRARAPRPTGRDVAARRPPIGSGLWRRFKCATPSSSSTGTR